jgi:hypothetical protein
VFKCLNNILYYFIIKMKSICFDEPYVKKGIKGINDELFIQTNHFKYLTMIHDNIDFSFNHLIIRELKKKVASYKIQDKLKKRYDEEQFIKYGELLNMLISSKLKCYYCNENLLLMYKNKNEKKQWSLERFDNNKGHYSKNCCISCLKCNLQRRTDNHEYFKWGKQMVIVKESN